MKAFLDTSVLIPAFLPGHEHHGPSLNLLSKCHRNDAMCADHGLLEVYSVLTRMPAKDRATPEQAMLFVGSIRERVSLVSLTAEESLKMLQDSSALGIAGGMIYDAYLGACALKAGAKLLYTWNTVHFSRLGPKVAAIVRAPR